MILPVLSLALQVASPLKDQSWKFDVGITGDIDFPNPVGKIVNPLVTGEISFTNEKTSKPGFDPFSLSIKAKRNQSDLVEMFAKGITDCPTGPKNDKDYVYITHQYWIKQSDLSVDGERSSGYDQSSQILNPFAIGVAIMRRAFEAPELKKEYFLMADGGRKFYGAFNVNLNATTDPTKGEIAFRFNIILKEGEKTYPKFFTGAVRANSKSHKIEYIKASSNPADGPLEPGENSFPSVKSFAFNLVSR